MALGPNPLDWPAEPFLVLYASLLMLAVVGVVAARSLLGAGPGQPGPSLGPVEIALLGDGRTRAADTVVVGLLEAGVATLDTRRGRPLEISPGVPFPAGLEPFWGAASGNISRMEFAAAIAPVLASVRGGLVRRGLAPSDAQLRRLRTMTATAFGALLAFGLVRVVLGIERDRPVGFLSFLLAVAVAAGLLAWFQRPHATPAGRRALEECHDLHSRAARAPLPGEMALAFALLGPAVLAGTASAGYREVISPRNTDSGSSGCGGGGGDGGSSGSGGGGDGGSGCGGCGGE